jgi:MFS family permease
MVVTCILQPALVRLTSIRFALAFGTAGYAPYAAGLYLYSAYRVSWLVIVGAALCGISAGVFWATEGAVILAYPERKNQGRYLSYWLMFRVLGQGACKPALRILSPSFR